MVLELTGHPTGCPSNRHRCGWVVLPAFVLLLLVSLAACSAAQPTPSPTPEPVDPRKELQRTVESLMGLETVSFDLEHIVGSTNILPGILMHRAYGRARVPGAFALTVEAESLFPRSYLEIEMVSIDEASYMTNVLNGEWEQVAPGSLPIRLGEFGATLAGIVEQVQSPELLGQDRRDGVDLYHIGGDIVSEVLKELVPTAGTGFPVALEMWIERDTGMLRQALITGKVVLTDVAESQRRLTLDDVNQPVDLDAPDL